MSDDMYQMFLARNKTELLSFEELKDYSQVVTWTSLEKIHAMFKLSWFYSSKWCKNQKISGTIKFVSSRVVLSYNKPVFFFS